MATSQQPAANVPALLHANTELLEPREETIARELRNELNQEFLKNYEPKLSMTGKADTIDERYLINVNAPITRFNRRTTQAYSVTDEMNQERQLYAEVASSFIPARQKLAQLLKANTHANILPVVAEGVVRMSNVNEDRYVVVYEMPKGKPLSEIIAGQTQPFSDRYLVEKVIAPLSAALSIFEDFGISHGCVNPENIYLDALLTLVPTIGEPTGYSQDFHYEPINRLQANVAGKGNGHVSTDYYALGVLVANMKLRPRTLQDPDSERFIRRLLKEGSYLGIVGYADVSDEMSDLLRGTLNDNQNDRWTYKQLRPWCNGKRFNLLTPTIPSLGSRPFELNEENYSHLRQLAHAIHRSWAQAAYIFTDGSLARWVELATRRRDISDYLNRTVKSYATKSSKSANEMITRCLFALDPFAPIRMKGLAAHIDALGTLYAELYYQQDATHMAELNNIIEQSIPSSWAESQRRNFNVETIPADLQQIIFNLDKIRLFIRTPGLGFGPERVLYELNPSLPCQSPILKQYYASTLKQLLVALDQISTESDRPDVPIDKHIAAFIAAKVGITRETAFNEFKHYPELVKHRGLIALKMLQQAQAQSGKIKYPGLSAWVTASITDAIGTLHSATVRKEMCRMLKPLAYDGLLAPITQYLLAYDYTGIDSDGFITASQQYAHHTDVINELKDVKLREYKSYLLGSNIAKFVAYAMVSSLFAYLYRGG